MTNVKLFIATPAFDGKTHVQYAVSLAETCTFLSTLGINIQLKINASGSLLVAERNRLIKQFLATDCTHILCIDSDLGWDALYLKTLLEYDLDFVAGLYPARGEKTFIFRPATKQDKSLIKHESKNVLKMEYIPAGFMLIKRHVLERMIAHFSHLYFEPLNQDLKHENGYCLFNTEVIDKQFWGEDYVFSKRVREAGFDIWVDPMIKFNHAGNVGMLAEVLTDKKPEEQPKG